MGGSGSWPQSVERSVRLCRSVAEGAGGDRGLTFTRALVLGNDGSNPGCTHSSGGARKDFAGSPSRDCASPFVLSLAVWSAAHLQSGPLLVS